MALAIDALASTSSDQSGTNTFNLYVSTSGTDRIVVVVAGNEGNAAVRNVQSVTATGLTFTKRSAQTQAANTPTFGNALEVWWAYAAAQLTDVTVTVTWDGVCDDAGLGAFAVSGVTNFVNPWDANATLPKIAVQAGSASAVTTDGVSTSAANTFVFWVGGDPVSAYPLTADVTPASAAECFAPIINTGGTNYYKANSAYKVYSSAQTNITVGWTTSLTPWVLIVDALTDAAAATGQFARPSSDVAGGTFRSIVTTAPFGPRVIA